MKADKFRDGGKSLYEDFKQNNTFSLMVGDYAPDNIEEAYEIQNEYMLCGRRARVNLLAIRSLTQLR